MKKLTTLIALLTLSWSCFAQEEGIIYTDFDPDWCMESSNYNYRDTLKIDFDYDNEIDLLIEVIHSTEPDLTFIPMEGWNFRLRTYSTSYIPIDYDTLVSTAPYGWETSPRTFYFYYSGHVVYGLRKVINDSTFCYGWMDLGWINACGFTGNGQEYEYKFFACIKDMAYCTIPNYPLRWGQTTITDIEENDNNSFASIHPNPTAGLLTIEGYNLTRAEVFNTLGQLVAAEDHQGGQISIDIRSLPAGLYLVAITDSENRKCVHKVVKK